ncbi:MAG TPA: ferric reductase-like transmembrane domain-containing protein [Candidatus Limnocylindrales bacterium]|nr:ferric reductase-like transmembrane domain-containing protein [Candidatus Limnocylindrales bacterium]
MSDQILWFASRGSGIVSLLLSTAVVCLGFLIVIRWSRPSWPRFLTAEFHRRLALLSIVFVGLHIATAILDPFTSLGLAAAIVPFASSYRPLAVALGVISVDLVLAVIVTSLLRERLGHRLWRAVHWLAYAAWPMAVLHSLTAGSDAFAPWMLAITGLCVVAVAGSLAWRTAVGGELRSSLPTVVATPSRLPGIARRRSG